MTDLEIVTQLVQGNHLEAHELTRAKNILHRLTIDLRLRR